MLTAPFFEVGLKQLTCFALFYICASDSVPMPSLGLKKLSMFLLNLLVESKFCYEKNMPQVAVASSAYILD